MRADFVSPAQSTPPDGDRLERLPSARAEGGSNDTI